MDRFRREMKGNKLYVALGASQVRKRLRKVGLGVRKVESAGKDRALIIHTATGDHLRELSAIFEDVLEPLETAESRKHSLSTGLRKRT
ncbi:MAG: hypothetical protein CMJ81_19260 [Planctomycetaceae bacterium]|jgi:hypothetical protein|nr:hypothetical protein [Planctomycetaceae bacterium]